jgi:hypothetical protein
MKLYFVFFLCLISFVVLAQKKDQERVNLSTCLVENGLSYINTPYKSGTLDQNGDEKLVCISNQFDCVTFVEYVLALSIYQLNTQVLSTKTMEDILTSLRYRHGHIEGYTSRIHYFTEWIDQQCKNEWVENITKKLGGIEDDRKINFISSHLKKYPQVRSKEDFQKIIAIEKTTNEMVRYYIPKEKLKDIDVLIKSGDIIAITTSIKGLDVSHVGIAINKGNEVYLLHASEKAKRVIISDKTLYQYLASNSTQTGIIVLRPK